MKKFIAALIVGFIFSTSAYAQPAHFVRGHLKCAVNVNQYLKERGIRGTGTARALDFLHWGAPSNGQPGDVAVMRRKGRGKGHVAVVAEIDAQGNRWVWNPSSSKQRWVKRKLSRRAVFRRSATAFAMW